MANAVIRSVILYCFLQAANNPRFSAPASPLAQGRARYNDDLQLLRILFRFVPTVNTMVQRYLLVFGILSSLYGSVHATEQRPPNVLLFLVDDLGWRDLGCYGSPLYETPNIDRFARESVRFTQAYAACHVCSPTRASILTGQYPARLQLTDWLPGRREFPFQQLRNAKIHQQLPLKHVTIAEALRQHGYRTAHFGKWHLGEEPHGPRAQGFELQIPRWNKGWPRRGYHAPFGLEGLQGNDGDYLTDRLTDEVEAYIDRHQEEPFFLYLAHFAVHDPIQGRTDLVDKYERKLNAAPRSDGPAFVLEGNPDAEDPLTREELESRRNEQSAEGFRLLPDRTVKIKQHQDNPQFAAMVESVDQSLARLLSKLESLGLDDNTIIIFFSDNGGMSGGNFGNPSRVINPDQLDKAYSTSNLPLRGGKGWLYEGGIRVPLIIHWPGHGRQGATCKQPVISSDLYPTILEMAGFKLRPDQHLDGVSLASLVSRGGKLNRQAIFWHFPHYSNHGMQSPGGAVRAGDYKLLDYFENGNVQLFNLRTDPGEHHDLSDRKPVKVAELRSLLKTWREQVNAAPMQPNPTYRPGMKPPIE